MIRNRDCGWTHNLQLLKDLRSMNEPKPNSNILKTQASMSHMSYTIVRHRPTNPQMIVSFKYHLWISWPVVGSCDVRKQPSVMSVREALHHEIVCYCRVNEHVPKKVAQCPFAVSNITVVIPYRIQFYAAWSWEASHAGRNEQRL